MKSKGDRLTLNCTLWQRKILANQHFCFFPQNKKSLGKPFVPHLFILLGTTGEMGISKNGFYYIGGRLKVKFGAAGEPS